LTEVTQGNIRCTGSAFLSASFDGVLRKKGVTTFFFTLAAGCAFASIHLPEIGASLPNGTGGGLGLLIGERMIQAFSPAGATLFLAGIFLAGFRLLTGISWLAVLDLLGAGVLILIRSVRQSVMALWRINPVARDEAEQEAAELFESPEALEPFLPGPAEEAEPETSAAAETERVSEKPKSAKRRKQKAAPAPKNERQIPIPQFAGGDGAHPPLELLDPPRKSGKGYTKEMLEELSRQVEVKLADFGVAVEVVAVHPGPVVTLFELQLAPGTKVSKITGLSKDIARALSTVSVRVVEVIPGKSVIGLEIPNEQRETVFLSEVLTSRTYQDAKSPLTLAMGTNIAGQPVSADLARMPHALIAGTTGSGKSVAINAMILSLVYKAAPRDVRLIMVDPKMLELSVYEGIPHLLTPVVTDMKEAANALRWCVAEMERRYRLMAQLGVRNIAGYNRKVADAEAAGEPIPDPLFVTEHGGLDEDGVDGEAPHLTHLPYIVVIIDELADMMMVVGKKVEELIARLAQKARASGIHLLLATQRPSVDVLTGLIKANIPTRMAFQVSARVDSRTILDQMGAEHLLGWGDMLYLPPGTSFPQRVHGAFVDDQEVHRVVEYLKQMGEPDYIDNILQDLGEAIPGIDPEPRGGDIENQDPLFDEAVQIVTETRRASISGVQRRLKIGYNRAARMIEEMERIGVVGPAETNGNREVLAPPPPDD
jgi:S-DNA-T family DNA segregation ATPase FtsK/SpoIIIE